MWTNLRLCSYWAKGLPPRTSKRPEDREFVVDSGASMHVMSNRELSSEEMGTFRRSRNLTVVLTANGEVQTHEEAQVFVHDVNQFVTVQLLEETPAVLSLENSTRTTDILVSGSAVKNHGWRLRKTIVCKTDNFVPLVVPGLSTNSRSESSSASPPQDWSS